MIGECGVDDFTPLPMPLSVNASRRVGTKTAMSQPRYYRTLDDERSAQKRTELQLSPRRHTAKTVLSRPPSASDGAGTTRLLVAALLLTLLATGLLVLAQLTGVSTSWATVQAETDAWFAQMGLAPAADVPVAVVVTATASSTPLPTDTSVAAAQPATSTQATASAPPTLFPTAVEPPAPTETPPSPAPLALDAATSLAATDPANSAAPPAIDGSATAGEAANNPAVASNGSANPATNRPRPRWLPRLPNWRLPTVNLGRVLSRGPSAGDAPVAEAGLANAGFDLLRMDSFDNRAPLLGTVDEPGRTAAPIPEEYRYVARLEANQVLWTTFEPSPDVASTEPLVAIETRALVNAQTPGGYVALVARHQDDDNLYLFIVDGRAASAGGQSDSGRFQVQLVQNGKWRTVQEWTASPALEAAGQLNVLSLADTVTDAGEPVLRFFVSDNSSLVTLYELERPALPPGRLGVAVSGGETGAEVSLNWLRLYGDAP